jgi:hypothetical protein
MINSRFDNLKIFSAREGSRMRNSSNQDWKKLVPNAASKQLGFQETAVPRLLPNLLAWWISWIILKVFLITLLPNDYYQLASRKPLKPNHPGT